MSLQRSTAQFSPLPHRFRSRPAAHHLGISLSHFHDLVARGVLPKPQKCGRLSFWVPSELITAFDAHVEGQHHVARGEP